jgi:hypothetical protein
MRTFSSRTIGKSTPEGRCAAVFWFWHSNAGMMLSEELRRLLSRLQFNVMQDRFDCTRADLIRLGKKADPNITCRRQHQLAGNRDRHAQRQGDLPQQASSPIWR